MERIKVHGNRVLVREHEGEKNASGLIVPDSVYFNSDIGTQKHLGTGIVEDAGEECVFVGFGDMVLFGRQGIAKIEHDKKDYSIMRETDVMARYNDTGFTDVNNDRVLVAPDPMSRTTEGGLFIPENAAYKPVTGMVLLIGQDCKSVKPGKRILFGEAAGAEVVFRGTKYLFVREADVVADVD